LKLVSLAISPLLLLLAAAPGRAATGFLDSVAAELAAARGTLDPGDPVEAKQVKTIDKILSAIGAVGADTPFPTEVKVAAKVAATIAKSLASFGDLATAVDAAADGYVDEVETAREKISVAIAMMAVDAKTRGALGKALAGIDKGLAPITPAASPAFVLKALSKVAKYAASVPSMPGEIESTWVVNTVSIPPATEGIDIDGDETIDNVLGSVVALLAGSLDVNQQIADALAGSPNVLLIQMWWSDAAGLVMAGMANGADTDADLTDNFSGSESFLVATGLDTDGHPTVRAETTFGPTGAYTLDVDSAGLTLPGLELTLPAGIPLEMAGTASAASNTGYIGFAVPVAVLAAIITGMGQPDPTAILTFLADIDLTPATSGNDAISAAMKYTAVPAGIQ
jgi:hypothetical protein